MAEFTSKDAQFVVNFFKMSIRDRYLGSILGSLWAILNPALMFGVYTFVFGYVFKSRIPGSETTLSYAIWLISGYGPWLSITESLIASCMSVVAGASLIKNIAFKVEVLPIASALNGIIPLLVSFCFLGVLLIVDRNPPTWHILFLFPIAAIQFLFVISLGLFFSSINVFIRDFGIVLPNLLTMLLFSTPVFYPIISTPQIVQILSLGNPFYLICEAYRQALVFHQIPNIGSLFYTGMVSIVLFFLGLHFFRRISGYFEAML